MDASTAVKAPTVKLLIGGQFVESKTTEWRDVVNPATQEVLARVPFATQDEINAAVASAKEAFKIFSTNPDNYGSFFMAAFAQALQFGIGVSIILYGVRIILGELVPAFQGIANKVVPGARPALDIPIVFPYGANASLIGFLGSFVGGLVALAIIAVWLGPVWGVALILPGMVICRAVRWVGLAVLHTFGKETVISGLAILAAFLLVVVVPVMVDHLFQNLWIVLVEGGA